MRLQLIRNATLRLEYANITMLIDPMLGSKHTFTSFAGIEENPTVDLPLPASEVLKDVDLILISHLHQDHFDVKAQEIIDKTLPILCQPGDRDNIAAHGFTNVTELPNETQWRAVNIDRTGGQHGTGRWAERLNPVSGFVFQSPGEPTVYWIGDSVWCDEVRHALDEYQPEVVVTHSGGAELEDSGPIIMDAAQTIKVCEALPASVIIATHFEALDHCKTPRKALRASANQVGITVDHLRIPGDGELIVLDKDI
jgi:L-ascorbate metabolism protein UlaG (beta-lactamase superfamily)